MTTTEVRTELPARARWTALPDRLEQWSDARPRTYWLAATLLSLLVALLVVVPSAKVSALSPVDELWYADAIDKASHGEITRTGAKVDDYTRQVFACRGVITIIPANASCGGPQPDQALPLAGKTSADIHAPTYFFLTAGAARVLMAVGVTNDLVIAGRLVGVLWLAAGLLMTLLALRRWGAGRVMPLLTVLALGMTPLLASVSGFITPDAAGLLVGAAVLYLTGRWVEGRASWLLLGAAAFATSFVKVPFVLAPLFCALLLAVRALLDRTVAVRRTAWAAGALVVGAGAGALAWQVVRALLAVGPAPVHPEAAPPVAVSTFARYFGYYLDNTPGSSGAPIPVATSVGVAARPLTWLLLAAAIGGLLYLRRGHPLLPVCWAGTAGMVFGSIVLSGIVLLAGGGFLIGTPRYGLALLPLWAVPLAVNRRPVVLIVLALTVALGLFGYRPW